MKILWLVNIIMPDLSLAMGQKVSVYGGWLSGALQALRSKEHNIVICTTLPEIKDTQRYTVNGTVFYIVPEQSLSEMQLSFQAILAEESPDIIHIYGTEYSRSLAMFRSADRTRTLVTIQGALLYYKDNVYAGLPEQICRDTVIHKFLRALHKGGQSIALQKKRYEQRAIMELEVLQNSKYINGGSEWGNAVGRSVNPNCVTFDCKLILRNSFYEGERWSLDHCEKHSIIVLHSYPIKGFHKFLEALKIVVTKHHDTKAYVVSNKVKFRHYGKLKSAVMNTAPDYDWYLQQQIENLDLRKHLVFLGTLNEKQMKEQMLKSHVFVSASSIENQSTTLGEAMILGVPSVASCVGAIQEMIKDGEDGFLYPFHEPYILANQIIRIFDNPELAVQFSIKGHEHAARTYDREENGRRLLEMYNTIVGNVKERSE